MNYLDQNYKHVIKKAMLDKTTDRRTYKILRTIDQDPYPEDYGRLKIGLGQNNIEPIAPGKIQEVTNTGDLFVLSIISKCLTI